VAKRVKVRESILKLALCPLSVTGVWRKANIVHTSAIEASRRVVYKN